MRTTLYGDDLQHLFYDHDDETFYMEGKTPAGTKDEKTREEAEDLLKHFQIGTSIQEIFEQKT